MRESKFSNECNTLEEVISKIPFITTTEVYETSKGCYIDFKDKELEKKLIDDTRGEFGAIFSSKGSVAIKDNKIYADLPINMFSKDKYHIQEKIGEIAPKACIIKTVHIHDSFIPAVHVHIECDLKSKTDLANSIKDSNKISRYIADL